MNEGNDKESTLKLFLVGLAAGAAAGAALSVLFGPRSDKRTKYKIGLLGRKMRSEYLTHWIEFIPN